MKRNWRAWILGLALLGACAESAALWQRHQSSKYLRYVSEPLPDGTRYTFLYPARMQPLAKAAASTSAASVSSMANPLSEVYFQEGGAQDGCTDISIQVGGQNSGSYGDGRDEKKDFYSHFRYIRQVRSGNQFFLFHFNCSGEEQPFEAEDRVFSQSFQILLPGAPVPSL